MKKKDKENNDFDFVAHVVKMPAKTTIRFNGEESDLLFAHLNKHGLEVGGIVRDRKDGRITSYDWFCWEEIISYEDFRIFCK